ncbi:hypothetical protein PC120_g23281 [Phytophthora cactorum]|nr:hypothetical protein PC120_g23281 [Phytophthora cactorum]
MTSLTASGHTNSHADCAMITYRSNLRPPSKNPDPTPTYNSFPSNARIASFFCLASG